MASEAAAPARLPGIELAPVGLVVVQPTPFCNIDCSYCYLPDRGVKRRMSLDTVRAIGRFLRDAPVSRQPLSVVWHAGEPLVMPVEFYDQAFEAMAEAAGPVALHNHFQTNATLLDDAWCVLFKSWSVNVGVSIDGPRHVHDARRVTRSGRGTFDDVMRGIETLRRHHLPFTALAVITPSTLAAPDETIEFLTTLGASSVAFNIEESEGVHKRSLLRDPQVRLVRELFEKLAAACERDPSLRIRELEEMRRHLSAPPGAGVLRANNRPGAIVSIDTEGEFSTFSPELLGLVDDRYGRFAWGNVHRHRLSDLAEDAAFQRVHGDIAAGVERCRQTCEYFSVCGGGDPSNKLTELGALNGTETLQCKLHVQALADVMMSAAERKLGLA